MQPYQRATEAIKDKTSRDVGYLKGAGKAGMNIAATLGGASLLQKALPFLVEGITPELAIRGLSKINPKIGQFIKDAQNAGSSFEEIKNFVSEKLQTAEELKPTTIFEKLIESVDVASLEPDKQQQLGFLEQISNQLESSGKDLKDSAFKKIAKKIKNVLKGKSSMAMQEASRDMGMIQGQVPPQTQPIQQQSQGVGQEEMALMAMMQKGTELLKKLQGGL